MILILLNLHAVLMSYFWRRNFTTLTSKIDNNADYNVPLVVEVPADGKQQQNEIPNENFHRLHE